MYLQWVKQGTKKGASKLLLLLFFCFALSACEAPEPDCLLPYDPANPYSINQTKTWMYPQEETCINTCTGSASKLNPSGGGKTSDPNNGFGCGDVDDNERPACVEDCRNQCTNETILIDTGFSLPEHPTSAEGKTMKDLRSTMAVRAEGELLLCAPRPSNSSLSDLGNGIVNWFTYKMGTNIPNAAQTAWKGSDNPGGKWNPDNVALDPTSDQWKQIIELAPFEEVVLEVSGTYVPSPVHYASWPSLPQAYQQAYLCYMAGEEATKPASVVKICKPRHYKDAAITQTYIDALTPSERDNRLCKRASDTAIPQWITKDCAEYDAVRTDAIYSPASNVMHLEMAVGDETQFFDLGKLDGITSLGNVTVMEDGKRLTRGAEQVVQYIFKASSQGGKLKLRYREPAETHPPSVAGNLSDNVIGYTVKLFTHGCRATDGQGLKIIIGGKEFAYPGADDKWAPDAYGPVFLKITDFIDSNYANNRGRYSVWVGNKVEPPLASTVVKLVSDTILDTLHGKEVATTDGHFVRSGGIVKGLYNGVVSGPFRHTVQTLLVLYVTFVATGFILGFVKLNQFELVMRLIKIGIILTLISEKSWEFFNGTLFTFFINGIMDLSNILSAVRTENTQGELRDFLFIDQVLAPLFVAETWLRITALMFTSLFGLLLAAFIYIGFALVIIALLRAVIVYVFSLIALGILMAVAPIFISFMLFEKTKGYYNGWVKEMVSYFLQPIFVFTAVVLFSQFLMISLYQVISFPVCWGCAFQAVIPLGDVGPGAPDIVFCIFNMWRLWGIDLDVFGGTVYPVMITQILMFLIFADLMGKFVDWGTAMGSAIPGAFRSDLASVGNALSHAMKLDRAEKTMKSAAVNVATAVPRKALHDAGHALGAAKDGLKAGVADNIKIGLSKHTGAQKALGGVRVATSGIGQAVGLAQSVVGRLSGDKELTAKGDKRRLDNKQSLKKNKAIAQNKDHAAEIRSERAVELLKEKRSEHLDSAKGHIKKVGLVRAGMGIHQARTKGPAAIKAGAKGVVRGIKDTPGNIKRSVVKTAHNAAHKIQRPFKRAAAMTRGSDNE